jgi:exonuclease III
VWCILVVMKIISWNVRGLGGHEKRREVCQLMRNKQPFIFCIQERSYLFLMM